MSPLNRCANIFFGYTPRFQLSETDMGDYIFLQPRDINPVSSSFNYNDAARIDGGIDGKYILAKGDLLILCKGRNTPVIVIDENLPKAVASSAFVIVRTVSGQLDPYYLAWYLLQAKAQAYLLSRKAGTTVLNLPIKAVQEVQVPLPNWKDQCVLGELYRERIKLRSIQHQLLERESLLMDMNLLRFLKQYDN